MTIFNRPLSEYIAFCRGFLIVIPLVGIVRLMLSLNGTPNSTVRWLSMTALMWIAVLYFAVRVHTTGFGSYRHLLVIYALLNVTTQIVSILGIVIAIVNGKDNVFTVPEFSFGTGRSWGHVAAHGFIGTIGGSLLPWFVGSLILFVTRKVSTQSRAHAQRSTS
jgi:hypothetical protein